jgi:hypothetical protein
LVKKFLERVLSQNHLLTLCRSVETWFNDRMVEKLTLQKEEAFLFPRVALCGPLRSGKSRLGNDLLGVGKI